MLRVNGQELIEATAVLVIVGLSSAATFVLTLAGTGQL